MNKEKREAWYRELKEETGYWMRDEEFLGLNLGFPILKFDAKLQREIKGQKWVYDDNKSCKENTRLIHGERALELVQLLLHKDNQIEY